MFNHELETIVENLNCLREKLSITGQSEDLSLMSQIFNELKHLEGEMASLDRKKNVLLLKYVNKRRDAGEIEHQYYRLYKELSKWQEKVPSQIYTFARGLSVECLDSCLKIMQKYWDNKSHIFLGKRANVNLARGELESIKAKKIAFFKQAFEDFKEELVLKPGNYCIDYPLSRVCMRLSSLDIEDALKRKVIDTGIKVNESMRESHMQKNFRNQDILGFFYLRRANLRNEDEKEEKEKDYKEGFRLVSEALKLLNPDRKEGDTSKIYSYLGLAFSDAFRIKTGQKGDEEVEFKRVEKNDLENLITSIACSEYSRDSGNEKPENYQAIGRQYFNLHGLIKKISAGEVLEIDVLDFKKKVRDVLSKKSNHLRGDSLKAIFKNYRGGLRKIDNFYENVPNLGKEIGFIALESALTSFEESARGDEGDKSLDNKSYRGTCMTELAKLNRWLKKWDNNEVREKLKEAKSLLENVVEKREEELLVLEKNGESEYTKAKLSKDYTRLSECEFRLADSDITLDTDERKKLYEDVIKLNNLAIARGRVTSQTNSFIASSHYKLVELSSDNNEKKKHLDEAINGFNLSFGEGDNSPENRGKTGSCYLKRLEIMLQENPASDEIEAIIGKARETLEDAVRKGKEKSFIYPYCLLAELSDSIGDNKIGGYDELMERYSWKTVVDKLFDNKDNLANIFRPLTKEKVWIVDDEYGLMKRDLVIKENENVEELKQEFLRNKFIYDTMKDSLNLASDSVPFSRPISVIQKGGKSYFVMRRSKGINLNQKFKYFAGSYAQVEENES